MPDIKVLVRAATHGQKKASLIDVNGLTWTFVHVPPEVEHLDMNQEWVTIKRPGDFPLVERAGAGLARIRLSWLLGFPDRTISIEGRLGDLKRLCRSLNLLRLDYGPLETGWWRCTDLSWTTKARNLIGASTRAEVRLELTRAVEPEIGALTTKVRVSDLPRVA